VVLVLGKILRGNEPEFLALFGRHRVGKTFLIREFFQEAI
jgi:AAA+ ATPase superfamily predicted ATPase